MTYYVANRNESWRFRQRQFENKQGRSWTKIKQEEFLLKDGNDRNPILKSSSSCLYQCIIYVPREIRQKVQQTCQKDAKANETKPSEKKIFSA